MRRTLASIALLALLAAPLSASARPMRTVIHPQGFTTDPGLGCEFGVQAVPNEGAFQAFTQFDDGRLQTIGNALGTYTNLETGASTTRRSNYRAIQTYDPTTNNLAVDVTGQFVFNLWPGDSGPDGVAGENGELFSLVGWASLKIDLDTFVITSFSHTGQVTDICDLLGS